MARTKKTKRTENTSIGPAPSKRERVAWLLQFLQRDAGTLRLGERLDLLEDLHRYLGVTVTEEGGWIGGHSAVMAVHANLRDGMNLLATKGRWALFDNGPGVKTGPPTWELVRRDDGTVERRFVGEDPTTLLVSAADLLAQLWPEIRRCACGVFFLPKHGRQQFHDLQCAARERMARFTDKQPRDYHAEYARRMKRKLPGAKPQRRARH